MPSRNAWKSRTASRPIRSLTGWRLAQHQVYEMMGSEKKKMGPMRHAFITTNPLLPPDYFAPKGIDATVLALNKGVPYSLLDCPGKYTVQVATFKGKVIIKQEEIKAIEEGKQMESELAQAAKKADTLTRALRMKGYEAYQFHDRYASIVTVGGFDSVGTPRPDGQTEINPEIHKIMTTFGADLQGRQEPPKCLEGVRPRQADDGHADQVAGGHPLRHPADPGPRPQAADEHAAGRPVKQWSLDVQSTGNKVVIVIGRFVQP